MGSESGDRAGDAMNPDHDDKPRDDTGKSISECYCPQCGYFSGGGLCRVCRRELAIEEQNATSEDDASTTGESIRQQSLLYMEVTSGYAPTTAPSPPPASGGRVLALRQTDNR